MATEVELPDGTILEVPDGADPSAVAKAYLAKQRQGQRVTGERGTSAVKRELGLGTRNILEGGMDVVAPFADLIGYGINKALPGDPLPYNHSQNFSQLLTRAGLPEAQTGPERGVNIGSRIAVGAMAGRGIDKAITGAMGAVPAAVPVQSPSREVLSAAQREGMVVPPAQVAPRSVGAALEGAGGTLRTGQAAAARNQPIINSLAARAVGVADEALTPEVLQSVRGQASDAYRVIRGAGRVVTDDDFVKQVQGAVQPFRSAAQSFASLANKELVALADDIAKPSFEADAAVDAIKMLRDKASVAYRAGSNGEGSAYRSMASALEGVIERHLSRQGEAGAEMLKSFRDARQLIAKTHTVEDALKGSNVDIAALGRMLKKGVPLTDELRLLGQFNQQFPGAANLTRAAQNRPAYSVLDWITGGSSLSAALATGKPELAIPAGIALARPLARSAALSPMIQRQMMAPLAQKLAPAVPYALGAAPTLSQFLAQQRERR